MKIHACNDCVFWDQSRENEFTGFCHRYAPSRPTPSATTVAGVHLSEIWPVTGRGAWCGEFTVRSPAIPTDVTRALYDELIYAVARKFDDETRHQTALRYIREAEVRAITGPAQEANP